MSVHAWQVCGGCMQNSARRCCACHSLRLSHVRKRAQCSTAAMPTARTMLTGPYTLSADSQRPGDLAQLHPGDAPGRLRRRDGSVCGLWPPHLWRESRHAAAHAQLHTRPPDVSERVTECMRMQHCRALLTQHCLECASSRSGRGQGAKRAAPGTVLLPMCVSRMCQAVLALRAAREAARGGACSEHASCSLHAQRTAPRAEMADVVKTLTEEGLCSEVYHKELYLPAAALSGAGPRLSAVAKRGAHQCSMSLAGRPCAVNAELGCSL